MAIEWKKIAFVENSAAQSVMGNPTGSPAVATAITVAEQTLVGRITGGNVDDLSVTQVKTLIGSSTTSATGVIELATQAEVLAGTDTSRAVVPIDLAARIAIDVNPKAMSQGVNMTYASSGSTGIQVADNNNIDFGTGNFSLVWRGSLPDWTPAAAGLYFTKYQSATVRFYMQLNTNGTWQVVIQDGVGTTVNSTLSSPALADNAVAELCFVFTRETASVAGSIALYKNGILFETNTIPAGTPPTATNTASLNIMGRGDTGVRHASVTQFAATYNRALSAADVLDLYRNGINFADKWGSQTAVYTSDFSAGVDGWAAFGPIFGTVTGNVDSIGGENDVLQINIDSMSEQTQGFLYPSGITAFKRYRLSFRYYLPSANTNLKRLGILNYADGAYTYWTTQDAWTAVTVEYVAREAYVLIYTGDADWYLNPATIGDKAYIKDVVITEIGATIALEPEGIQPAPGQWLDSSTNKLHAWQPVAGSSLTRKKTEFEIRGINTWTASHAAQSIAMTSDASRVMLPPNCYIESIVGVVAGADIEDIIVGDGSDADRWVELTTGLAAGTVSFMLANRISDGTNYELVVDPDADCTMTITWTIKGYILD